MFGKDSKFKVARISFALTLSVAVMQTASAAGNNVDNLVTSLDNSNRYENSFKKLNIHDIEKTIAFHTRFAKLTIEISSTYPGTISGLWLESAPGIRGHIRFKGEIPHKVQAMLNKMQLINKISLSGGDKLSLVDQLKRVNILADSLQEMGYQHSGTMFNQKTQRFETTLDLSSSSKKPSRTDIAAHMRKRLQENQMQGEIKLNNNAVGFSAQDLDLSFTRDGYPMLDIEHSHGDNWLFNSGYQKCIDNFALANAETKATIEAKKCSGVNPFKESGLAPKTTTLHSQNSGDINDANT